MDVASDFANFVRANSPSLFATAVLLTGDATDAEELLQGVLVNLYPQWHRVLATHAPVAYVRRCVINGFLSARRSVRARPFQLAWLPDRAAETDPYAGVLDQQLLRGLLAGLTAKQRAAIVLRYLDDQPDTVIARAIGCRPATVRSLISRGLTTMRTQLRPASNHPTGEVEVVD